MWFFSNIKLACEINVVLWRVGFQLWSKFYITLNHGTVNTYFGYDNGFGEVGYLIKVL